MRAPTTRAKLEVETHAATKGAVMRLSEAMRLGAMNKPQASGAVLKNGGTCALGAALDAIGLGFDNGWFPVYDHWPIATLRVAYPGDAHRGEFMMVGSVCWILNDVDRWTREAIADWVETIERAGSIEPGTHDGAVCPQDEPQIPSVRA